MNSVREIIQYALIQTLYCPQSFREFSNICSKVPADATCLIWKIFILVKLHGCILKENVSRELFFQRNGINCSLTKGNLIIYKIGSKDFNLLTFNRQRTEVIFELLMLNADKFFRAVIG